MIGLGQYILNQGVQATARIVSFIWEGKLVHLSLTTSLLDVDNNPAAFKDAYWEIDSVRVYTPLVY